MMFRNTVDVDCITHNPMLPGAWCEEGIVFHQCPFISFTEFTDWRTSVKRHCKPPAKIFWYLLKTAPNTPWEWGAKVSTLTLSDPRVCIRQMQQCLEAEQLGWRCRLLNPEALGRVSEILGKRPQMVYSIEFNFIYRARLTKEPV